VRASSDESVAYAALVESERGVPGGRSEKRSDRVNDARGGTPETAERPRYVRRAGRAWDEFVDRRFPKKATAPAR